MHELRNGDCYFRVGDESRRLSFAQRHGLEYDRGHAPYDGTVVSGVPVEDGTESAFAEDYRRGLRATSVESMLRGRSLMTSADLTVAAVLLFADQPRAYFPHGHVRVLRFTSRGRGTGARQTLEDGPDIRCEGSSPDMIHRAAAHIEELVPRRRVLGTSGHFESTPIVPRDAWLEGLVDAVIHRSYSAAGDYIRWAKNAIGSANLVQLPRGARRVLAVLRSAERPLGTGPIVELTGQARPTVLRHLRSLVRHRLVEWEGQSRQDPRATGRVV